MQSKTPNLAPHKNFLQFDLAVFTSEYVYVCYVTLILSLAKIYNSILYQCLLLLLSFSAPIPTLIIECFLISYTVTILLNKPKST